MGPTEAANPVPRNPASGPATARSRRLESDLGELWCHQDAAGGRGATAMSEPKYVTLPTGEKKQEAADAYALAVGRVRCHFAPSL